MLFTTIIYFITDPKTTLTESESTRRAPLEGPRRFVSPRFGNVSRHHRRRSSSKCERIYMFRRVYYDDDEDGDDRFTFKCV